MELREFFDIGQVMRNGSFETTYSPHFDAENSIAYAISEAGVHKLNADEKVVALIVLDNLSNIVDDRKGLIVSENPQKTYYELHNTLVKQGRLRALKQKNIDPSSQIDESARISDNVWIGKNVKVGIGVIIRENCFIDDNCIIDDYAVLGSSGMQNTSIDNEIFFVESAGGVRIGKNSHILTGSIIQSPYHAFFTEIGQNTKISNKTVIGHGSKIGSNVMIAGNCQIAGNVTIGNSAWIGPSSTVRDGLTIGKNSKVRIGSVVIDDVQENMDVSGNFAYKHKKNLMDYLKRKR